MIKVVDGDILDVFIVYARPITKMNESSSPFLNGKWFVQTIGQPSETLIINLACKWSVLQEIIEAYNLKTLLEVEFLDFVKRGVLIEQPTYDIGQADDIDPIYIVDLKMAVILNV